MQLSDYLIKFGLVGHLLSFLFPILSFSFVQLDNAVNKADQIIK
jgi:hypothetical protein